jgi:hypothetical protein
MAALARDVLAAKGHQMEPDGNIVPLVAEQED